LQLFLKEERKGAKATDEHWQMITFMEAVAQNARESGM